MKVPTDGSSCLLLSGEFGRSPFFWQLSAEENPACLQAHFTGRPIRSNSKRRFSSRRCSKLLTAENKCDQLAPLTVISGQWLAPNIGGAFDLDQHADAGVGADMGLFARQEQIEYGVVDRPAVVQFGTAVESQKARVENAVALRLEVGVDHANALVVAEVFQRLLLRALPIGEMVVVENDHAALGRDVGAIRALRRDQARRAVIPGRPDEGFKFFADRHEMVLLLGKLLAGWTASYRLKRAL